MCAARDREFIVACYQPPAGAAGGYASTPTILYSFCSLSNCADGADPAGLIVDTSGNLFCTTTQGGSVPGTVFEIAKTTSD